jgi:hypothetical protein
MEVIIIDSVSHEWEGAGGILNIHGNMTGNSFTNWNKVSPRHNAFAQIVGRARMLQNMPFRDRKELPQFPLSDSQVNLVVKDYYSDESYCRNDLGNINLWKLFNLFTGANKMTYIDNFLDRNVGCQQFTQGLHEAIGMNKHHWFVD